MINLVYDYTLAGESTKARDIIARSESLFDREIWNRWRFFDVRHQAAAAECWLAVRSLGLANRDAERLLANSTRYAVPKYVAIAHRLLGEIAAIQGDFLTAEQQFSQSIEVLTSNPVPLIEWRHYAAFGRMLDAAGRPAAARDAFRRAVAAVQRVASHIDDPGVRSTFLSVPEIRRMSAK